MTDEQHEHPPAKKRRRKKKDSFASMLKQSLQSNKTKEEPLKLPDAVKFSKLERI